MGTFFFLVALKAAAASNAHPLFPLDSKFRVHFKCPYAEKWLFVGPEQAARELGLKHDAISDHEKNYRLRQLQTSGSSDKSGMNLETMGSTMGSCTYTAPFVGESCMEFRGDAWTSDSMQQRCDGESSSTFTEESRCDVEAAAWCVKVVETTDGAEAVEAQAMVLSAMADCGGNKMACETFVEGSFVADVLCSESSEEISSEVEDSSSNNPFNSDLSASTSDEDLTNKCIIAPGAIGAAHQSGFSSGYSSSCPNTPAQNSPYMWPLKWAADFQTQSMAYGSDEIIYTGRGRTYYSMDKNIKRSDSTFQEGTLRTIGQTPCDEEDVDQEFAEMGFLGCHKNLTDSLTTMIHKGDTMYLISWKNDSVVEPGETDATKIEECSFLNPSVIGNIRPDWFLDKRGDDTDTQYLGNQHVFYLDHEETIPRLVKQWRKKDFASQYFVMSMLENPKSKFPVENGEKNATDFDVEDTMHWPLILNIPGEGFGDDQLQVYRNHEVLTEEHDELFMLVENYEASGGVCVERSENAVGNEGGEGTSIGPPVLEAYIPSNLEVDPNSWQSNEYTFSPFWVATEDDAEDDSISTADTETGSNSSSKAITDVSDRVTIESCYDEATQSVDLTVHFMDIEPTSDGLLPWMAVGYRSSEVCAMTPPSGGDTPIILVRHADGEAPRASTTNLKPEAKSTSTDVFESMIQSSVPLEDTVEYTDVALTTSMSSAADTSLMEGRSSAIATEEDSVILHFKQTVEEKPDVMYLMYAIGMTSELGFHTTRVCFTLDDFPSCPEIMSSSTTDKSPTNIAPDDSTEDQTVDESVSDKNSSNSSDATTHENPSALVNDESSSTGASKSVVLTAVSFAISIVGIIVIESF